jgi:UDP-N-acetylglucosamine transferase subunit ALG13
MILVITGTEAYPFDRLIKEIDSLKEKKVITEEVFIQLGSCTYIPRHCTWQKWLSFGEMKDTISKADMVIAHAGAGTTLLCLELGKTPLIVTRRKEYGEHLDDHQVPFAKMMEELNYAVVAYNVSDIKSCMLTMKRTHGKKRTLKKNNDELISYLNTWLS